MFAGEIRKFGRLLVQVEMLLSRFLADRELFLRLQVAFREMSRFLADRELCQRDSARERGRGREEKARRLFFKSKCLREVL